ncbi:hypothetical protein Y032_0064g3507 [Ancylostoma ceylanicum]|uniref:Amiloride-sensitive sodium channel n=1 Tax=Ancylostoma ceylanicum TaxID=53326 RepID=A0A016U096_9BILA|nr:hypothetical protein Y032_0064g3507 [Ancylostoma ceylanicum]
MSTKSDVQSIGAGERIYLHIYDYETKEFSGLTTYHGLVRIYNSNTWPSRIFWCVVVLSCLSLFMIHSGYLLLGYHSKPTLFQVNTIVAEDGLSFPEITICNYNPVKTSELTRYNMTPELFSYMLMSFKDHVDEVSPGSQAAFEDYITDYSSINNRNFSIADFFKDIRPTCEDMVLSCSFAGEIIEECCSYSDVVPTDLGYCIRFPKSKLNKTQYLSGSSYGWQFVLNGNNALYPDNQLSFDMGFRVLVHEPGKEFSMEGHGLSVPPGAALYAGISVKNISLLQRADWGYCQHGWDPKVHGELLTNLTYTATHCEWNCLAREWLSTCGCLPMKLLPLHTVQTFPICTPLEISICADTVYVRLSILTRVVVNATMTPVTVPESEKVIGEAGDMNPTAPADEAPPADWLVDYMTQVAGTGKSSIPWTEVQPALLKYFERVMKEKIRLQEEKGDEKSKKKVEEVDVEHCYQMVYNKMESLANFPKSFRRLCLILTKPPRCYSKLPALMNGLLKVVEVGSIAPPNPQEKPEQSKEGEVFYFDDAKRRKRRVKEPVRVAAGSVGRGRPKKSRKENPSSTEPAPGRGLSKKSRKENAPSTEPAPGRGRPKKSRKENAPPVEPARSRGRPRKCRKENASSAELAPGNPKQEDPKPEDAVMSDVTNCK